MVAGDNENDIIVRKVVTEEEEWTKNDLSALEELIDQEIYDGNYTKCVSKEQINDHLKKFRKK